jgi:hypothetical protein
MKQSRIQGEGQRKLSKMQAGTHVDHTNSQPWNKGFETKSFPPNYVILRLMTCRTHSCDSERCAAAEQQKRVAIAVTQSVSFLD